MSFVYSYEVGAKVNKMGPTQKRFFEAGLFVFYIIE